MLEALNIEGGCAICGSQTDVRRYMLVPPFFGYTGDYARAALVCDGCTPTRYSTTGAPSELYYKRYSGGGES